LIIELDGSQHMRQATPDARRTQDLESQGYRVIRFWNDQVLKDIQAVGAVILDALDLIEAEGPILAGDPARGTGKGPNT
jgi:very-short-patch-repair endonuclease